MATKQKRKPATIKTLSDNHHVVEMPQAQLARCLRAVVGASDTESSRYALGAVRVEVTTGEITLVATDGRRLAYCRYPAEYSGAPFSFSIPTKQARELSRMYTGRATYLARIEANNNGAEHAVIVAWTNGNRKDKLTRADYEPGRFPRWDDIVAGCRQNLQTHIGTLSGEVQDFRAALAPRTGLTISANGSVQIGQPKLKRNLKSDGKFHIILDPDLVLGLLDNLPESEQLTFYVRDADNAVWVELGDHDGAFVIMPMSKER